MRQQLEPRQNKLRVSSFIQFLSALIAIITPLVVYLVNPETVWYIYGGLTLWPLVLLLVGSVISGSTSVREAE